MSNNNDDQKEPNLFGNTVSYDQIREKSNNDNDNDKNALEEIKAKGLGAAVTAKFGKNATQCKTPDLLAFLAEQSKPASQVATIGTRR